ncbi:MAG: hypothetical protein H7338_17065 [Candidatus Sericytochromatia bacterium]|nr:hypothetical protein [Candidatus Sericytochromatia bacterium]
MDLTAAQLALTMTISFAVGWVMMRIAQVRQTTGTAPYDRAGFPAPGHWGLVGWLATPIVLAVFLWRFGWGRWIIPAQIAWWGLLMALGAWGAT